MAPRSVDSHHQGVVALFLRSSGDIITLVLKKNVGEFFSKLINGEQAAYKIGKLAILRQKYRLAGLAHICQKLDEREDMEETAKWRVCSIL